MAAGYAATAPLSDVRDINALLYLNPELVAYSNVRTPKEALVHFHAFSNLPNVMPSLPAGFDAKVFVGAQSNVSPMNRVIRDAIAAVDGVHPASPAMDRRGAFVGTLMCAAAVRTHFQAGADFPFSINLLVADGLTPNDLQPDDRIRLVQRDSGFIVEAAVREVSYERSRVLLEPSANPRVRAALACATASFDAFGIRVYDPPRQACVAFARAQASGGGGGGAPPSGPDAVPAKEFVYDMYQLMYPETRCLGFADTYLDYRRKWERGGAFRIRGPVDLLNVHDPNAAADTLRVGYGDFSWMSPSNVSLAEGYVRISADSFAAGGNSTLLYASGQYASLCSNLVVGADSAVVRSDMQCMGALTVGAAASFGGGVAALGGGALVVREGGAVVQVRDMLHIGETLGIGTSNPDPTLTSVRLAVGGDIFATGTVVTLSDRDAKTDVEVIADPLERVRAMRGCTFRMKEAGSDPEAGDSPTRRRHTGLIAQEVQATLPEVVFRTPCGSLSVAYGNLAGLLVESIKALEDRLERVEDRLIKTTR
eukprot:gene10949-17062_t